MQEQILPRIQKLLALSQSSNEHEAALALAKAEALLAEHNLTLAQVQVRTGVRSSYVQRSLLLSGRDQWRRDLLAVLARFSFCEMVYWAGTPWVSLVGETVNLDAVCFLYPFVGQQLEQFATSGFARYTRSGGRSHGRAWKTSFYQGALEVIRSRLQTERQALETRVMPTASAGDSAGSTSTRALLVRKEQDLKEAMQRFYPSVHVSTRQRRITALDGYSAGRDAGHQVRFRQEVE